jgi:hypothetical protein
LLIFSTTYSAAYPTHHPLTFSILIHGFNLSNAAERKAVGRDMITVTVIRPAQVIRLVKCTATFKITYPTSLSFIHTVL